MMRRKNAKIIPLAICFIMFAGWGLLLSFVPMHQLWVHQPATLFCTSWTKKVIAMHYFLFKILVIKNTPLVQCNSFQTITILYFRCHNTNNNSAKNNKHCKDANNNKHCKDANNNKHCR